MYEQLKSIIKVELKKHCKRMLYFITVPCIYIGFWLLIYAGLYSIFSTWKFDPESWYFYCVLIIIYIVTLLPYGILVKKRIKKCKQNC